MSEIHLTVVLKTKHCCLFVCRFSTEDLSSSPEKKPKPASSRHRNSADWLGLKVDDDLAFLGGDHSEAKSPVESPKSASPPLVEKRASALVADASAAANDSGTVHAKAEVSKQPEKEEETDDWLAGALSRKKAQSTLDSESKSLRWEEPSGPAEKVDPESNVR